MNERVLLVEDDPQGMRLLEMTLRAKHYILHKAIDGEEALKIAKQERPDLIVMDMRLPKMSGFEVTAKLRQDPAFRHTPIIGVTAYAMRGDKEMVLATGCNVYLSKPIDVHEFSNMVAFLLSQQAKDNSSS
ncbi:MAG: response regulator [Chloroflexota bacterium]